jgi:hypothetical protein
MRRFLHLSVAIALTAALGGCGRVAQVSAALHIPWLGRRNSAASSSARKGKPRAAPQRYAAQTATLKVTFGLQVAGVVPLPEDFVPDTSRPPMWLQGGSEVGVIGTRVGKGAMLGFSAVGLSRQRVVIEDYSDTAGKRLLDAAISADGRTIATAVADSLKDGLEMNLIDASNTGEIHPVASIEGEFDSAQLIWLSEKEIALAAVATTPGSNESTAGTAAVPVSGLYLTSIGAAPSIQRLDGINCRLSPLRFSPTGAFAVAQGADNVPPAIIDLLSESCVRFLSGPVKVLGWAPNSAAFLYRTADQAGVFRFDMQNGRSSTIAISSDAAAYASDGTIIAFGSQELSWGRAVVEPMSPVKAQIALLDPHQNLITLTSLGFLTLPALLAQSTMVLSQVSNDAIIDTAIPTPGGLVREIIEYSYPARAAFVLAQGPVRGSIALSWSPDGKRIAIVDGEGVHWTLAVIAPPK